MRFTLSWLRQYLDTNVSLDSLVKKLSDIGIEVSSVDYCDHLRTFVVAEVLEVIPHRSANKLRVCKVFDGKETFQIVCGASNVRAGMKSVLAHVGSVIPKNQSVINVVKLRGVESYGMLCSKDELGIINYNDSSDGIIELPSTCNVGDTFFPCDPVIEVNITPNRGDCLGVYGIARDLVAAGIGKLRCIDHQVISNSTDSNTSPIGVCVQVDGIVKGRYIKGIKNRESPKWLKDYLLACGINSVSFVVDITNYIMLSFNRPLHVYDASKITKKLIFKKAEHQVEFSALNNKKYILGAENIIAVDLDNNVHGIAGIIGSQLSSCLLDTKDIFLESAWFNPVDIVLSSRKIKLSTDASYRFERFLDPKFLQTGLDLATKMILEYCGGKSFDVVSDENYLVNDVELDFPLESVRKVGNVDISVTQISDFLIKLGFIIDNSNGCVWKVTVPSWRSDIKHHSDVIEEVLRLYGYDQIVEEPIPISHVDITDNCYDRLRSVLLAEGLMEVITWSFTNITFAKKLGYDSELLLIDNPISDKLNLMRPSILLNLLQVVSENQAYGNSEIAIFEIGQVYSIDNVCSNNSYVVGGVRYGNNFPRNLYKLDRSVDIFDVKSDVISILQELNIESSAVEFKKSDRSYLHPVKSADVYFNNVLLGYFGELHPDIMHLYEIKRPIVCFEIFLYKIPQIDLVRKEFVESCYQCVKRDFAFLINKDISVQRLIDVTKNSNTTLIDNVAVFDLYEGNNIGDDKLSVALSVTFKPVDHTLNDQEIKDASDLIINAVAQELGGVLRSF
ncbi:MULTISPECIES: phenylalanine--tRNA ligase subunit beta [Ehrlichia]|uniref:Phenylalanine--tRNA ligase beta subunit n=1 Tax=Ehrlichia cf. muris str. EmCRT TaxID=1359167 RepID=A0A0F3NCJ5_9RICK|nr:MULTISPECIES: phenylalanine--tRNA ligase subunit beta [Ehrlichia]KJV65447.1 phenylalanine--tRNA ligase, beta subunit [Ehrlichia cf. muris str. EmCRT]OUC04607.1 phenylalanyl-tRNA synthetase subunit beta [Ehrlichia sp. Wisconsin_h]